MRLSDCKQIFYGKEDPDAEMMERKDIIYQIFLGDRQVWERTSDEGTEKASNKITTTWRITNDLTLKSLTESTIITGKINWGDSSVDDWRSGEFNIHYYVDSGLYNITFDCELIKELPYGQVAAISRIEEYNPGGTSTNELIGVTLGKVPFASHRLDDDSKGVFEDVLTIESIVVPQGVTKIPQRLFYNTSFEEIVIPAAIGEDDEELEIKIEQYAFVSNVARKIRIESKNIVINSHAFGFDTDDHIINNLKFYCYRNTRADTYAQESGIDKSNIIYIDDNA